MKRPLILFTGVAAVAIACASAWWLHYAPIAHEIAELESFDHRDGDKEAEADLARGIVNWKVAGRVSDYEVRAALLKAKLKTELDWFGDCAGSEGRTRYVEAYNSRVRRHLVSVYGEAAVFSVLGEAYADAAKKG